MAVQIGASEEWVHASPRPDLLRLATGIEPEPSLDHVRLDRHSDIRSTQRIAVADVGGSVIAGFWPAELKPQAQYLYSRDRGRALIQEARARGWSVTPSPHLAFYTSPPHQRLYMTPDLAAEEYARRWEGPDGDMIGQHEREEVRQTVWPWLKERGYASDKHDDVLEEFLGILGRREAHLRPGFRVKRQWPSAEVRARSAHQLAAAIRQDLEAILGAAGEPALPPTP